MPVKIWNRENSILSSRIETTRPDSIRGESFRAEAEALDQEIDRMLDLATELSSPQETANGEQGVFRKRWAIGRAMSASGLLESEYLEVGEKKDLWLAIALKCRLGVRADGRRERRWQDLIPKRDFDPKRTERDVFALGLWLQEQDIEGALLALGGSRANAIDVHRRASINSKNMRNSLARWFGELSSERRVELSRHKNFLVLTKALAKRFPARGPGSAKRPVHYAEDELYDEVGKVLDPLASELVP